MQGGWVITRVGWMIMQDVVGFVIIFCHYGGVGASSGWGRPEWSGCNKEALRVCGQVWAFSEIVSQWNSQTTTDHCHPLLFSLSVSIPNAQVYKN